MNKHKEQMPVKYKQLDCGRMADSYFERSLDLIFSPGCFTVEIDHSGKDVGLPIDDCGEEHYFVGNLVVTDSGTAGHKQENRVTGQLLTISSRNGKETKLFTRTFADGLWSKWSSLARTGMYDNISTPDELLATVESLVDENTRAKEVEESVKRSAVDISSLASTAGNENVTITGKSMDGEVVHSVEISAATTEKAGAMSAEDKKILSNFFVSPNNNNYIKNWAKGNKAVIRLYVENKEKAISDGLYIRQLFRQLNKPSNCGFNFGTKQAAWAITIEPDKGEFDTYETTHAAYGKIAIRVNWEAVPVGSTIGVGNQTESNLEDIVFDYNEFSKPLTGIVRVGEEAISESNLTTELKDKINSPSPALVGYELFSLGDSLSAEGVWQTKVAELTGCTFDQKKNNKGGAMLSVGGTYSFGDTFDNVLWRAKNLIEQGYITNDGANAIVILENVNDGYVVFNENVKSVIPTTPIEGYNEADFSSAFLENIKDKAQLNAVLRLNTVVAGKNLKIDTLPTKAGTVTLRVGWIGPGYSNYNIYVEPQATEEETLNHVLDKILEYAYTGITDVLGEDGKSVDFSSGDPNYLTTVIFTDTDNTGMSCTVTDNPNAKGSVARYFIGENISEWTDTTKWQKGISYSQGWKSTIEMLQRAYPKLHIFVSMFPLHSVTASEYLLPYGTYNTAAYNKVSRMEIMRNMQVELNKIAKFYSLPFLDVFAECGIGINNMLTYYNAVANVHPKNEGYYRFGEIVAAQLKRFLV